MSNHHFKYETSAAWKCLVFQSKLETWNEEIDANYMIFVILKIYIAVCVCGQLGNDLDGDNTE